MSKLNNHAQAQEPYVEKYDREIFCHCNRYGTWEYNGGSRQMRGKTYVQTKMQIKTRLLAKTEMSAKTSLPA